MSESVSTLVVTIALFSVVMVSYWIRVHRRSRKHEAKKALAVSLGQGKPVAQHPRINDDVCMGCGACAIACPEKALGIIDGVAHLVQPGKCVGHGICAEACPVSGINIILDPAVSKAELPLLDDTFQTQVQGLYIIGELGGMALIRNSILQGKKVVDIIAAKPRSPSSSPDIYDLIIVGAGPAGMSAALQAMERGLKFAFLEKEASPGGTILNYPRQKLVLTVPVEIPYYGWLKKREISKEELMEIWASLLQKTGLPVMGGTTLGGVRHESGLLVAETEEGLQIRAGNIVLALGRRGNPRKLGVPGETLSKVAYQLQDAAQYTHSRVLVVGAGDSGIEASLGLSMQKCVEVTLVNRSDSFTRAGPRNRERILEAAGRNRVQVFYSTTLLDIRPAEVVLKTGQGIETLPNDYVFVLAGGESPFALLRKIGVTFRDGNKEIRTLHHEWLAPETAALDHGRCAAKCSHRAVIS